MADMLKARILALQKLVDEMADDIVAGDKPEEPAEPAPEPAEPADESLEPDKAEEMRRRMQALMNE